MELKDIKLIIDLMKKNDLSLFELEKEDFKIKLKRGADAPGGYAVSGTPAPIPQYTPAPTPGAGALAAVAPPETSPPAPVAKGKEIVSPMVGTFYSAMSPDAPPYLKVGQIVTEDTVVCIIEAMKVMNEIKAEVAGTVTEVLGENGKPVQFGQVLFRVQ